MDAPHIETLTALGFTALEAAVYAELLATSPASGYAVAKGVGKAAANVYQALGSLAAKGAVLVDEQAGGRLYRATPPQELLAGLSEAFSRRTVAAAAALEGLQRREADDRIYTLTALPQVIEKARGMIRAARETLLFDLFPDLAELLWPELAAAAARGVSVAGLLYADPPAAPGGIIAVRQDAGFFLDRWPGRQLTLVVDGREYLAALLGRAGPTVEKAIWSDSAYLACLHHSGLAAEIRTVNADPPLALPQISLLRAFPPGLRALVGQPSEDSAA